MSDKSESKPPSLNGSWVLINNVEEAEEATALDKNKEKSESNDSDVDSDGISVISETQMQECSTDDDNSLKKVRIRNK